MEKQNDVLETDISDNEAELYKQRKYWMEETIHRDGEVFSRYDSSKYIIGGAWCGKATRQVLKRRALYRVRLLTKFRKKHKKNIIILISRQYINIHKNIFVCNMYPSRILFVHFSMLRISI